ncbi:hypothetical protein ES703_59168 [subsurface metagenome]
MKDNVRFIQGSILDLKLLQESFRGVDFVVVDGWLLRQNKYSEKERI